MMKVPFFRPSITEAEIDEVVDTLRSGWLTTGPKTKKFEQQFAEKLGVKHAVAVNSCTAALHLSLEAVGIQRGELVLVPTYTFAATAEVVRYFDAIPVMVDCTDDTLCMDMDKARETLESIRNGKDVVGHRPPYGRVRAMIPVHYGGQMADVDEARKLCDEFKCAMIEDAAHCLPAFAQSDDGDWRKIGTTGDIVCFSFYANKCMTTGEGGMAVTNNAEYADRMRVMSLHGMSKDAWRRFDTGASWYYEIVAPGFKYNLTDIASAIGIQQLARSDALWEERTSLAAKYSKAFAECPQLRTPFVRSDRKSSWHLYPIRIDTNALTIDRGQFIEELGKRGIGTSVHWMPLHLHPYYRETYGTSRGMYPVAEAVYDQIISLPLFPGLTNDEQKHVIVSTLDVISTYKK